MEEKMISYARHKKQNNRKFNYIKNFKLSLLKYVIKITTQSTDRRQNFLCIKDKGLVTYI